MGQTEEEKNRLWKLAFPDPSQIEKRAEEKKKISRRQAISNIAAAGAIVAIGAAAGVGGYFGGAASVPAPNPNAKVPGAGFEFGQTPSHPGWKFGWVNHVTTNPFFVPTQYGIADADRALGTTSSWGGSTTSTVSEMVDAFNALVAAKVDGIATTLIDLKAFNKPTDDALAAGIPVIGYNADARIGNGPVQNNRLAYVGQSLFNSGRALGQKIAGLIPDKNARIGLFIATPGSLNIQPRIDGAVQVLVNENGYSKDSVNVVGTDPLLDKEGPIVDSWYLGHTDAKGMFAVDAGDTQSVGDVARKEGLKGKVFTGGFDLLPGTLSNIKDGFTQVTIDQQPYLQGFVPEQQLYIWKLSKGLMAPSDTDTSLSFVTAANVGQFLGSKTRFEGSTDAQPTF